MNTTFITRGYRGMLLTIVIATAPGLRAQSFQVDDFVPALGVDYYYNGLQGNMPYDTTAGVNETWDFSTLMILPGLSPGQVAIDPTTAPYIGSFPAADVVVRKPAYLLQDAFLQDFFDVQDDALYMLGYTVDTTGRTIYTDPELRYAALDLGDTLTDPFCYMSIPGDPYDTLFFCGSVQVSFASTGTLVLPYGTYTDARLIITREASWLTDFPDFVSVMVRQDWFLPGSPHPVLSLGMFWDDGEPTFETGILFTESTLESLGIADQIEDLSIASFPNPATDQITLRRSTFDGAELEVLGSDGRVVLRERWKAGADQQVINVASFAPGIYTVQVRGASGTAAARFVKE